MAGKYQAYPEYKDSGVEWLGEIPSSWDALPIKMVSRIFNGATPKSGVEPFWDGDISWVTPADLGKSVSPYISKGSRSITNAGYHSCGVSLVPKESIILASRAPIGTLGIASNELCTNQGCKSLVVKGKFVPKFLYYVLLSSTEQLNLLGRGSTFLELSADDLGSYKVPSPSEGEQEAVTNFLDYETAKIDTLIDKQQQLIQLLKEKRQAVISHAVTKGLNPNAPMRDSGVEWLGEVPEHWEVMCIKHLSTVKRGASPRPIDDPRYFDESGDYAWVRIADVSRAGMYLTATTQRLSSLGSSLSVKLEEGELFVSIAGTVGKPCITVSRACIHDGFVYFPELKINNKYLYYIFEAGEAYLGLGKMGTQLNLNTETVGGIKIGLPSTSEIEDIVLFIEASNERYDSLINKADEFIKLMQERRTALISAAVTGKIDVRHHASHPVGGLQPSKSTVHGDL